MSLADAPAPTPQSASMRFFSRLEAPYVPLIARTSTWPFRAAGTGGHDEPDIRIEAARVIRTTARHWWPAED